VLVMSPPSYRTCETTMLDGVYLGDERDNLRPHVPRLLPAKRSLIRTSSSVHAGGELR
jgi:hypothetical protein